MIARVSIGRAGAWSFFVLWMTLAASPALDLTPRRGWREGNEGPPTPVLQFSNGRGRIDYQPPPDWRPDGAGRSLVFLTPEPNSWMRLIVVDKGKAGATSGAKAPTEDLQTWAAGFAPPGVEKLQFIKTVPTPFTLGSSASTEFLFTCTLYGFRLSLSISVIDFSSKERLVMLVCAEPGNFEHMRQKAIDSMFSWSAEDT